MTTQIETWLDYAKRLIDAGPQGGEHLIGIRALHYEVDPTGTTYPYLYRSEHAIVLGESDALQSRVLGEEQRVVVRAIPFSPERIAALHLAPVLHRTSGQYLVDVADAAGVPLELMSADGERIFELGWHRHEAIFYERGKGALYKVKGPPEVLAAQAWYNGFCLYRPGAVEAMFGHGRGEA